jgi:hypothetical protein
MLSASRLSALLVLCAVVPAGCNAGPGSADAASEPRAEYEAVGQQFGEHVLKGDWAAAYAMTTGAFQGAVSQARLKAAYDELLRQIRADDPMFRPNRVETDFGSLPEDEAEARTLYDIAVVPPKSTWKAWIATGIGFGDEQGIERGIDAWMLIVDVAGELKIAHVNFEFMD